MADKKPSPQEPMVGDATPTSDVFYTDNFEQVKEGQNEGLSRVYVGSGKTKRGGKRPGTGGSKSILAGGKRRMDPNTGWPTCYGDNCDKPAKKLSVVPTQEGSFDLAPICHDCATKGAKKGLVSRPLTTAGLEQFKSYDEKTADAVPGSIHGERNRVVVEPSGRRRVRKDSISNKPQTRMRALEARIREEDPSGPTGITAYTPSKYSHITSRDLDMEKLGLDPESKPEGWYTVRERITPIVGADPLMITRSTEGDGFGARDTGVIQSLYHQRHLANLRGRRTKAQGEGLLSNFLTHESVKKLQQGNKKK